MDPPLATSFVASSWETFGNCVPTDPRSSWYSGTQQASEINPRQSVPVEMASISTESSSAVHLELVTIFRVEYLAGGGRSAWAEVHESSAVLCQSPHGLVIGEIPREALILCQNKVPVEPGIRMEMFLLVGK